MPILDVYAPTGLFPAEHELQLASELTRAAIRAEGFPNPPPAALLDITCCYLHWLPPSAVHTARASHARIVRIQVTIGAGGLDRNGQMKLVGDATEIVTRLSGDPGQAPRTFVVISEAMEGGWGIAGVAYGKDNSHQFLETID